MFHKPAHKDTEHPAGQIEWKESRYNHSINLYEGEVPETYPTTENLRLLNEWLASVEELDHNYSYSE